jgi:hypothetical protein
MNIKKQAALIEEIGAMQRALLFPSLTRSLTSLSRQHKRRWVLPSVCITLLLSTPLVVYGSFIYFARDSFDATEPSTILQAISSVVIPMIFVIFGVLLLIGCAAPKQTIQETSARVAFENLIFDFEQVVGENLERYYSGQLREFISWRLESQALQFKKAYEEDWPRKEKEIHCLNRLIHLCQGLGLFAWLEQTNNKYTPGECVLHWVAGVSTLRPWRGPNM